MLVCMHPPMFHTPPPDVGHREDLSHPAPVSHVLNSCRLDYQVPLVEPRFTEKKSFGKVPVYLKKVQAKINEEKEYVRQYLEQREMRETNGNATPMPEHERQELLHHLKTKWAEINAAYQTKLGFVLDTPAKKTRKESYERQLAEIEKDIELLSRGSTIVVVPDY